MLLELAIELLELEVELELDAALFALMKFAQATVPRISISITFIANIWLSQVEFVFMMATHLKRTSS